MPIDKASARKRREAGAQRLSCAAEVPIIRGAGSQKMSKRSAVTLLWIGVLLGLVSARAADEALPPEQAQGEIRYRSGGIGADESAAMKAARADYALSLLFASTEEGHAAYASDVHVSILAADGSELLETVAEGPYLLVELPPGRYHVVATARGEVRKREVRIVAGKHQQLGFQWTFVAPAANPAP